LHGVVFFFANFCPGPAVMRAKDATACWQLSPLFAGRREQIAAAADGADYRWLWSESISIFGAGFRIYLRRSPRGRRLRRSRPRSPVPAGSRDKAPASGCPQHFSGARIRNARPSGCFVAFVVAQAPAPQESSHWCRTAPFVFPLFRLGASPPSDAAPFIGAPYRATPGAGCAPSNSRSFTGFLRCNHRRRVFEARQRPVDSGPLLSPVSMMTVERFDTAFQAG